MIGVIAHLKTGNLESKFSRLKNGMMYTSTSIHISATGIFGVFSHDVVAIQIVLFDVGVDEDEKGLCRGLGERNWWLCFWPVNSRRFWKEQEVLVRDDLILAWTYVFGSDDNMCLGFIKVFC